jgi:hypothetical protein
MKVLRLRRVRGFEEDKGAFAVICHDEGHWGTLGLNTACDPVIFANKESRLESICWEMPFGALLENIAKGTKADLGLINKAEDALEGHEVVIPDDVFSPQKTGCEPGVYHEKDDVYMIRGPRQSNKALHLGKGFYFLLYNNEVVGLVLKNAKKAYETASEARRKPAIAKNPG